MASARPAPTSSGDCLVSLVSQYGWLSGGHQRLERQYQWEQGYSIPALAGARHYNYCYDLGVFNRVVEHWEAVRVYRFLHELPPLPGTATLLWHGTPSVNINSIGHHGLRTRSPGKWGFRREGMLGYGVYLAPKLSKAFRYTSGQIRTVLMCSAVLGSVVTATAVGAKENQKLEGDSVFLPAGHYKGAWTGQILNDEYCVRDDARVTPLYLLVYVQK